MSNSSKRTNDNLLCFHFGYRNSLGLAKMRGKQQSLSDSSLREVRVHLLAIAAIKQFVVQYMTSIEPSNHVRL